MSNSTYAWDRCCPEDNDLLDETEKAIDQFSTKAANGLMKQLRENLQTETLRQFEKEFEEIVAPYKGSHNYKNLCVRLIVWQQNLWRYMLSKQKEGPTSEDLDEDDSFDELLQELYIKYNKEVSIEKLLDIASNFVKWQKQKIVDEACGWLDSHAIDYWGTEAVDNGMMLNDFRKAMNEK